MCICEFYSIICEFNMSRFNLDEFKAQPSVQYLGDSSLTKDDWVKLGTEYCVHVKSQWKKARIINEVINGLVSLDVLGEDAYGLCEDEDVETAIRLRQLELEHEESMRRMELELKEKEFAEKERERAEKEKFMKLELESRRIEQIEREKEREEKEKEREEKEKEREREREKEQHELAMLTQRANLGIGTTVPKQKFDVTKHFRLVPTFDEEDPEEFFLHFEKVAGNLEWPKDYWPALLQSALTGKGRSTYLSLSVSQSSSYDTVKEEIKRAYELTLGYYS